MICRVDAKAVRAQRTLLVRRLICGSGFHVFAAGRLALTLVLAALAAISGCDDWTIESVSLEGAFRSSRPAAS